MTLKLTKTLILISFQAAKISPWQAFPKKSWSAKVQSQIKLQAAGRSESSLKRAASQKLPLF